MPRLLPRCWIFLRNYHYQELARRTWQIKHAGEVITAPFTVRVKVSPPTLIARRGFTARGRAMRRNPSGRRQLSLRGPQPCRDRPELSPL